MNNVTSLKSLALATALALGLASQAFAGDEPGANAPANAPLPPLSHGLLGQTYASLGYSYSRLDSSPVNANALEFAMNQGISTGFDTLLEYTGTRSDDTGVGRLTEQTLEVGARAYTNYNGIKPYAEAGLGWTWLRAPLGLSDNSFVWFAGVGAEFQATSELTVTPVVRYSDATSYHSGSTWDFGVKANYWLSEKLGLTGKIMRNDSGDMTYGVGINFRY
jgi:opacity protein-like surface antigen